ncbi:centromere protein C, partial [Tremellales sp. Uapishka_1]
MPQLTTPGGGRRGRNAEKQYVPFNNKPKDVGTRTGIAMPTNIPLNEDGFEDPDEFFKSPAGINTTYGSFSMMTTPAPAPSTVRKKKGRMSELAGMEAGGEEEFEVDLLGDDDLGLGSSSTPASYFNKNPPPTVSLPRNSELPQASPSVNYDDIPSPRRAGRKSTISPSKRKSRIGVAYVPSPSPGRDDELGIDDALNSLSVHGSGKKSTRATSKSVSASPAQKSTRRQNKSVSASPAQKQGRRSEARGKGRVILEEMEDQDVQEENEGQQEEEEGGEVEDLEDARRISLASRKSVGRVGRRREEEREEGGGGSASEAGELLHDLGDMSFDDAGPNGQDHDQSQLGGGSEGGGDDDVGGNGDADENADLDGDVSLENDAMRRQERDEEDGHESDSEPFVKKPRKKTRVNAPPKEKRTPAAAAEAVKMKRSRLSTLEKTGKDGVHGDFQTRSKRLHFAPLKWWKGEKFEYTRGHNLAVIKEVIHLPDESDKPPPRKKRQAARSKSRTRGSDDENIDVDETERGWDDDTNQMGMIHDHQSGEERMKKVASTWTNRELKPAANHSFSFSRNLADGDYLASGFVFLPVNGEKPGKLTKDNSYIFYVVQGAVKVSIHKTSFIMAIGGQFLVPRDNEYSLTNIAERETQLFFAQVRSGGRGAKETSNGDEENEEGSEEEDPSEEEEEAPKRKVRKAAG